MRSSLPRLAVLLALLALGLPPAFAEPTPPPTEARELPAAFRALTEELAKNDTVRARFEQTKRSVLFMEEVRRTGTLRLRRTDGRLRWTYDQGPDIVMVDGRPYPAGVTVEQAGAGAEGFSVPGMQEATTVFEALFRLDPDELAGLFVGEELEPGTFRLRPRRPESAALFGAVTLQIGGEPLALRRVEMEEATGDVLVVAFPEVSVGEPFPDELFMTPQERSAAASP